MVCKTREGKCPYIKVRNNTRSVKNSSGEKERRGKFKNELNSRALLWKKVNVESL